MSGEQVLRAGMLKQMHCWSYEDLAFHLSDSPTFRTFCRIGMLQSAPKRPAMAENIKRVKPETFERVNQLGIGTHGEHERLAQGVKLLDPADQRAVREVHSFTGKVPLLTVQPLVPIAGTNRRSLRSRWLS